MLEDILVVVKGGGDLATGVAHRLHRVGMNVIVTELAQCYRVAIKSQKDLKLRTSLERLANYLLRQQARADGASEFDLTLEKRRLASFLGMTPENLSRAFKGLQPYGVSVDGTHIVIGDRGDLESFAKPNPLIDDYST